WNPKLVQYVSPQVWASRPGRADQLAEDYDLLLSIFPFEKEWYAKRVPKLRVEFIGHPMVERFFRSGQGNEAQIEKKSEPSHVGRYEILLLPGSRVDEVRRHLSVMLGAVKLIQVKLPECRATVLLPTESLAQQVKSLGVPTGVDIVMGGLQDAL